MPRNPSVAPKPPTTADVSVNQSTIENPLQPDFGRVIVPGGFAKEGDNNLNDVTWSQSEPNITGTHIAESSAPDQLRALLGPDVIKQLIDAGVKQALVDLGVGATTLSDTTPEGTVATDPAFKPLKHYRNDASPEIMVQELNMDAEVPQLEPIRGSYMRFRRGHFFAQTENQVKQLDWMMDTASHSGDTREVLGGNAGIYVDTDEKLYYCTAGCSRGDFHTASLERYKAHMRGVHGVTV